MPPGKPDTAATSRREIELDLERLILRDLQYDEIGAAKVWGTLSPADFQCDAHGLIYAAWRGLAQEGQPLDWTHLTIRLAGELDTCGGVAGVVDALSPHLLDGTHGGEWSNHSVYTLALAMKKLGAERRVRKAAERVVLDPSHTEALLEAIKEQQQSKKLDGTVYLDLEAIAEHGVPPVQWVIPGWLAEQDVAMLAGDGGIGKSTTAAALAVALSSGTSWCGIAPPRPIGVLYFDEEQSEPECSRMFLRLAAPVAGLKVACQQGVNLTTTQGLARLEHEIREHRPGLVIMDSVQQVFLGANENDAGEVAKVYSELFRLRRDHGVMFLLIHHMRKPPVEGKVAKIHMVRGSTAHHTQCSTLWVAIQSQRGVLEVSQEKRRGAEKQSLKISYSADGDDGRITLTGEGPVEDTDSAQERAEAFIVSYLLERGQSRRKDIVAAAMSEVPAIPERSTERALAHLTDRIKSTEKVGRGVYRMKAAEAPSELWE